MKMTVVPNKNMILFEDCKVIFKNFKGDPDKFGNTDRVFHIVLDNDVANELDASGFKVNVLKPRNEEEELNPRKTLKIKIGDKFPVPLFLIDNGIKTPYPFENIGVLDMMDIEKVDLAVNPFAWTNPGGRSGKTAYLKALYFTVSDDPLGNKYADAEENIPF